MRCNMCPKTFASWSGFYKHKKVHLGEKNYVCEQCNKSFIFNYVLKEHSLIHTGEKQFKCDYSECFKTFASRSGLYNHKKAHSRVECKHCSESFNLKNDLKKHSLTHLYCNLCPKTFVIDKLYCNTRSAILKSRTICVSSVISPFP